MSKLTRWLSEGGLSSSSIDEINNLMNAKLRHKEVILDKKVNKLSGDNSE